MELEGSLLDKLRQLHAIMMIPSIVKWSTEEEKNNSCKAFAALQVPAPAPASASAAPAKAILAPASEDASPALQHWPKRRGQM